MVYNPFLIPFPPSLLPPCSPEYGGPRPVFTAHYANAWSKLPWMGEEDRREGIFMVNGDDPFAHKPCKVGRCAIAIRPTHLQ